MYFSRIFSIFFLLFRFTVHISTHRNINSIIYHICLFARRLVRKCRCVFAFFSIKSKRQTSWMRAQTHRTRMVLFRGFCCFFHYNVTIYHFSREFRSVKQRLVPLIQRICNSRLLSFAHSHEFSAMVVNLHRRCGRLFILFTLMSHGKSQDKKNEKKKSTIRLDAVDGVSFPSIRRILDKPFHLY